MALVHKTYLSGSLLPLEGNSYLAYSVTAIERQFPQEMGTSTKMGSNSNNYTDNVQYTPRLQV